MEPELQSETDARSAPVAAMRFVDRFSGTRHPPQGVKVRDWLKREGRAGPVAHFFRRGAMSTTVDEAKKLPPNAPIAWWIESCGLGCRQFDVVPSRARRAFFMELEVIERSLSPAYRPAFG